MESQSRSNRATTQTISTPSPYFTAEHEAFRQSVRSFIHEAIIPFADQWEQKRSIPREIWQTLGNLGLLGLHYPTEYGGGQKDLFFSVVLLEELGRSGYAGFRVAIAVHAYMATYYLVHDASEALKRLYLPPAIAGAKVGALAITEPQAGSDLNQIQTTAKLEEDCYVLNGVKRFVANGTTADFIVMAARTAPATASKRGATGISLIVLDTNVRGFSAKPLENLGWHCSDTAEIYLENVRVPASNLIGKKDYGFYYIMQGLQLERLAAALLAIGGCRACLDLTCRHLEQRQVFGQRLWQFQSIRHRLADLATEVVAAQQLIYYAVWLYQHAPDLPVLECSMAKLKATELANRVVDECLQFHGASGYMTSHPISRMYRDMRAGTIAGGASEVMRDLIAQMAIDGGLFIEEQP